MSLQRWAASSWSSEDLHSAHQQGILVDGLGVIRRMSFTFLPTYLFVDHNHITTYRSDNEEFDIPNFFEISSR